MNKNDNLLKGGVKGHKGGGGRPSTHAKDFVKKLCGDEVYKRLWEIGQGKPISQYLDKQIVVAPASVAVQEDALKYLANRMDGMPAQAITPVDGDGNPLVLQVINYSSIQPVTPVK